jgi:hypothetical protein
MKAFLLRFQESTVAAKWDSGEESDNSDDSEAVVTAGTKTITEVRAEATDPDQGTSVFAALPV